jgi:uncharacterized protein YbjT (DUF2867 family)
MENIILITGATGQQGSSVIRHLQGKEYKLRALTRHPEKAESLKKMGVEIVQGDLTDKTSLGKALQGVTRLFLAVTPYEAGTDSETTQGINAIEAAKKAGVDYIYYSSVGSAQRHTGIPHFDSKRRVEEKIFETGLKFTILRPVFFMDNFSAPWMLPGLQQGNLTLPVKPDKALAMVTVNDIGAYAAAALVNPDSFIEEEIELAGEELTFPQALTAISCLSGAEIKYNQMSYDDSEKNFGHDFAVMFKWFNEVGYNPNIPELEKVYGIPVTSFGDYLKAAPWIKSLKTGATADK